MNDEAMPTSAHSELESIYAELQQELDRLQPVCRRSSRCCRFKEYGHQLWTTRLELDYLLAHEPLPQEVPHDACPYLQGGLCGVRDHRMLGCRIYFCDPRFEPLMGPLYEKYHRRIRDVHARHGVPYEYAEFLEEIRRQASAARPSVE